MAGSVSTLTSHCTGDGGRKWPHPALLWPNMLSGKMKNENGSEDSVPLMTQHASLYTGSAPGVSVARCTVTYIYHQ